MSERRHDPFGFGWPNVVSAVRILLIPVVVALVVRDTEPARWLAAAVFAVGAASDLLDGYLARRHEMKTPTGAWLDPLSDKLFVAVPAVVLSLRGEFPWWATAVIVARELAVTWLRWRLDQRGGVSMPASRVAKLKTASQLVAIGLSIAPLGQIADTNSRWISEQLAAIGIDVTHHQAVGDNLDRIADSLRLAASRADVVLVCGGLGPTEDDITRDAIAAVAGVPLLFREDLADMLREKFRGWSSSGSMPESNLRQASVPEGARTIAPDRGTAPGLIVELDGARLYAVPGVPDEMREMLSGSVVPELRSLAGGDAIVSQVLRVAGTGESAVAERLSDLFAASANPTIAYLASMGEVKVRLTAKAGSDVDALALLAPLAAAVRERLGDAVFTERDESLEEVVIRLLRSSSRRLACAESLTGGGVGERLTSVPGASAAFLGSAVAYTADMKRRVLGLTDQDLAGGTVTEACALGMARGALGLFGADVALSLTGAAGPEPHDGAEPGTIWVAIADKDGFAHARGYLSRGERDRVRRWAEQGGLDLVRRYLEGVPLPGTSLPRG